MNSRTRNEIAYILAVSAFGTVAVFVKNINLSTTEIALYRGVIAVITLSLFIVATKKGNKLFIGRKDLGKLFLSGAAIGGNWILLFTAFHYTSIAISTLCYYFAPTLIMLGSIFLFGERPNKKNVVCFVMSTAGLILSIGVSGGGTNNQRGVLLASSAAVLYATVVLINRGLGEMDGLIRTWYQFVSACLVIFPYAMFTGGIHLLALDAAGWCNLLVVGIFHTGIVYYVFFSSMAKISGFKAAILSYLDPCVAVFLSIFLVREQVSFLQLTGGAMILVFAVMNEWKTKEKGEKI